MPTHEAALLLADPHPACDGHFPGQPILPGAVLLQIVAGMVTRSGDAACVAVPSVKFLAPVRPGETLSVAWDVTAGDVTGVEIRFTASVAERRVMAGTMRLGGGQRGAG